MFFAAREAVRREFRERGRQEGLKAGQKTERERIRRRFAEQGIVLTPEMSQILDDDITQNGSQSRS